MNLKERKQVCMRINGRKLCNSILISKIKTNERRNIETVLLIPKST